MRVAGGLTAAAALLLAASALRPAFASDPPAAVHPGPGDPLPPIHLDYDGAIETDIGQGAAARVTATGGALLTYGDLRIHADEISFTRDGLQIEARGHVSVVRGDERFTSDGFTFSGEDGTLDLLHAVAVSPPFYLSGSRITRDPKNGLVATSARFVPSPNGRGEIALTAREIQFTADGESLILRHTTLTIANRRFLMLPYIRLPIGERHGRNPEQQARLQFPILLRYSGVAGAVVGIDLPVQAPFGIYGSYWAALTQRTQPQLGIDLRRNLAPSASIGRDRPSSVFFSSPGGMNAPGRENLSPLRSLAIARTPPPVPDPILDYQTILTNPDPVSRPTQVAQQNLYVDLNVWSNRDYGLKRQGPLVLSQLPELSLNGSLPIVHGLPRRARNPELRRFLRTPRLQLIGNLIDGHYREHRLQQDHATVTGDRSAYILGVGTLPLLIADHVLFRPQFTSNNFTYRSPIRATYRYTETDLTLDYIFSTRTMVGGTLIRRNQYGRTPFTFDQVDTRNEGQIRGQVLLPHSRFTIGSMLRYDLQEHQLFDTEIAASWRGQAIEPRLSFQTLNRQVSFGLTFPGLVP